MKPDWLQPLPLVAILRGLTPTEAPAIGAALYDAGFRILEVPLNSPQPLDGIAALGVFPDDCAGVLLMHDLVVPGAHQRPAHLRHWSTAPAQADPD